MTVVRGQRAVTYPARAMLVAACNGCPCARPAPQCTCNDVDRIRYARRLSGPLLDRIDIVCELGPAAAARARQATALGPRARRRSASGSLAARRVQAERCARDAGCACRGCAAQVRLGHLSGRGQDRVLRLARTIADLAASEDVEQEHLEEALGYRLTDPLRTAA